LYSPEPQFLALTTAPPDTQIPESSVEPIFNALQPIKPSFMLGSWSGGSIDTGHPGHKTLLAMRWAGKEFRSVDDADPIVVFDEKGERVFLEDWGHSSVCAYVSFHFISFWRGRV
jgi:hypothetical protein